MTPAIMANPAEPPWSDPERRLLQASYHLESGQQLSSRLGAECGARRSQAAIRAKASRMGLASDSDAKREALIARQDMGELLAAVRAVLGVRCAEVARAAYGSPYKQYWALLRSGACSYGKQLRAMAWMMAGAEDPAGILERAIRMVEEQLTTGTH